MTRREEVERELLTIDRQLYGRGRIRDPWIRKDLGRKRRELNVELGELRDREEQPTTMADEMDELNRAVRELRDAVWAVLRPQLARLAGWLSSGQVNRRPW